MVDVAVVNRDLAVAERSAKRENSVDITRFSLFLNIKKNSSSWYLAEFILSKCPECASNSIVGNEVDAVVVVVIFVVTFVVFVIAALLRNMMFNRRF